MEAATITAYLYVGALPTGAAVLWYLDRWVKKQIDRRHIRAAEADGWTYVGKVEFMCIYPIDGGCALKRNKAYFGIYGLRDDATLLKAYYDRSFILYSKANQAPNELPSALVRDPKLSRTDHRQPEVKGLWRTIQSSSASLNPLFTRNVEIKYLSGTMRVADTTTLVANQVKRIFNYRDPNIRVGYFSQGHKKQFNHITKRNLLDRSDPSYCLSNYSSYTMVNSESVKDLKESCGRTDLSYKNFRPHIVFKGKEPYIEDGIKALRIGDLEFDKVVPCIHYQDVNLTFKSKKPRNRIVRFFLGEGSPEPEVHHTQPYNYLRAYRQICKYYVNFANSALPTFGVNFECNNEDGNTNDGEESKNVIRKGYNVYAKYYRTEFELEQLDE